MTAGKRAGGRPRDPDNDAAILAAALEMLIERGVDGTSIEQVAKRAGVARLTVYRRFATKEELLVSAVEAGRATAAPELADIAELSIDQLVDAWVQALMAPGARGLLARMIGTMPDSSTLFRSYWRSHVEPRRKLFLEIIQRERSAGRLPADTDPELFQDLIAGAVIYRLVINPEVPTAAEFRSYLFQALAQLGYRRG